LPLPDVEDILFRSVAGAPLETEFVFGNRRLRLNHHAWRKQQMQELLELQNISSLNTLLSIYQNIKTLIRGDQPGVDAAARIGNMLSELRTRRRWLAAS
jgi:ribosome assembly protein YihI (activator of Der GTPase)